MWTPLGKPGEEFPEWVQPLGVHDAYEQGAKVSHNSKKWVSNTANNVWEPGVYGWDEYVEPVKAQEAAREPSEGPEEAPGETL